ncbi:MAG TPA: VWA domain-containing protein [Thermoanaerobaculia bacterium]|nr:VWA domain-containing protein [Thermoanaerobaculia bacterium]
MRNGFFAVLAALALTASAQMQESITVSLVEVPVTVVDSSGNPIRGLTAANFKLYDQGKEVTVNSVDTIDFASKESMSAVSPLNPAARRKFLVLFDLSFSKPSSLARAQEAARAFVTKSVQPRDLVGVGTIDKRGFRLVAAFTTDRKLVADAITNPVQTKTDDPLHLGRAGNTFEVSSQESGVGKGNAARGDENLAAIMADSARQNRETVRGEAEKEMDFLGDLAKTLRGIPGKKQVVLLSEGFDPRFVQGSEAREDLSYAPSVYDSNDDKRFGSNSASSALRRMAETFRGSDVVLHALDIQGLRVDNSMEGGFVNSNDSLRLLAQPTGGMVFKNANKIETDFERLMKAEEVVYVLSFQAPASKPGKFHDLKVKLVNVPGGAKAFARAGYYEAGTESQQERALTNAEIVMNDVEQKDLRTASLAAAFPTATAAAQVPVIVEINGADLEKQNAVDFYIYAFDEEGTVRDRLYQRVTLDLGKVGTKLRANGLKYWATLALPPGKYAVKTLVLAGTKKGFARADVVVPAANQLAAAPIFVDESSANWVLVKGTSHAESAAYPFDLSGEHFIPAATPRTKRFAVFVPNAKPEDVTFETKPKVKFLGAAKSAGSTALVMELDQPVKDVELTIRKKGVATPEKIPLHLVQ